MRNGTYILYIPLRRLISAGGVDLWYAALDQPRRRARRHQLLHVHLRRLLRRARPADLRHQRGERFRAVGCADRCPRAVKTIELIGSDDRPRPSMYGRVPAYIYSIDIMLYPLMTV